MADEFDVIVIGAGPAGEVAAGRLGSAGRRVALIERELIGGECSYYACMPSKALLRPAELLAETRRVPGLPDGELDVGRILERRDEVIHHRDDSSQTPWLEDRGVTLVRGEARITGERRVTVGDRDLIARDAVVVATGSGPSTPPIDGLAEVGAWSNREITTAKQPPASLIVLGGGVVGVEMAQAWSHLGTEVTIVEGEDSLLVNEEPFVGEQIRAALEKAGVRVLTGVEAVSAGRDGAAVTLSLEDGETLAGEQLLVAVGRRPHVSGIGLETIGIQPDGPIEVDDHMRAGGRDWLYAVGDVNGRALLTHEGKYQARVAAANILGEDRAARDDGRAAPRVIFTDPEVAATGMTLAAAREAGIAARAVDAETAANAGASFRGRETPGTTRFVIDEDRDVLVGVTIVGTEVAEMLHAATIAVVAEVPLTKLADAAPPFPTRNEIWLNL